MQEWRRRGYIIVLQAASEAQAKLSSQELFWEARLRSQAEAHQQVVGQLRQQLEERTMKEKVEEREKKPDGQEEVRGHTK